MKKMVMFYPEGHQDHQLFGHPERPERVETIRESLIECDLWDKISKVAPLELERSLITAVHTSDYLDELKTASARGSMLDPDTYTTRESWQLALNAAGGAVAVAKAVWDREFISGFALCRPPGHHATRDRGMGFCLINNIAVAAEFLLMNKDAKSLAILDLDLHHGNGTQDIYWQRSDVSFSSIHQSPFYPGTGYLNEIGAGAGEGLTMNLPIPSYSGDQAYLTLVSELILPFLNKAEPEMLLVSFGFDTHWKDPLGSMQVSAGCIYKIMETLQEWSGDNCEGRLAVILEGGYDLEAGRSCGQAIGTALAGIPWTDPIGPSPVPEKDNWKGTLEAAKQMWDF